MALVAAGAGPSLVDLGEGAPWWAKLVAAVVSLAIVSAPFILPRLTERRTGNHSREQTRNRVEGTSQVTAQPDSTLGTQPAPTEPDPEIAAILETLRDYRDDLRMVRREMAEAEERHRREMAEAERRHQEAMATVLAKLDDRERTITRLEGMIDVLTGRRQPPPQGPTPRP